MKKTRAHCNNCDGEKHHEILFTTQTAWAEDELLLQGKDTYDVLKCCGCDRVILMHTSWFSHYDNVESDVFYYPPSSLRKEPRWLNDMSGNNVSIVKNLLSEVYVGVQNNAKMIAAMGVRALIENVMIDTVGDHGNFRNNLTAFMGEGYISRKQKDILTAVLEVGHAAMHRSYQPAHEDLIICIDIVESVLQAVYVHPGKVAKLEKRTPKKKKKG